MTLALYRQDFVEYPEQLLTHVETMLTDISQVSKVCTRLMTVAMAPSTAYYFMPETIHSFQACYPRMRIRLIDSSVGNMIEAVSGGQANFSLRFAKDLLASLGFTPLADDCYAVACRYDHPLAHKTHFSWQVCFEQGYIDPDRVLGNQALLDRELVHLMPTWPGIYEAHRITTMLGMVEAGIGIAVMPAISVPAGGYSILRAVSLTDPAVIRTVGLAHLSDRI